MSFLFFLTFNLSVPLYLRFKQRSIPFYARGVGFLEDFFIILELFLVASISISLAVVTGLLLHLVLMLDSILYKQMQLRLRFSYLIHLRHAGSFYSSAKELGLKKLIGSALGILALHSAGYFTVYRRFDAEVSLLDGAIFLGVGAIALVLAKSLPKKTGYAVDNLFFSQQIKIFQKKAERLSSASLSFPKESFRLLDESYPLWRMTKGFEGEKQFDLKIGSEEKPHVILLFLESFSSHGISYEKKATPHFDQLAKEGILFSNFYSNGTFTYRAMLAGLFGLIGGDTAKGLGPYVNIPYVGLPQLMKQAGYTSAFFHNGSLSFDKQREFLKNHFDLLADRTEIEDSPHQSTSWGAHDECLMRYTANWLEKQDQPAFMTLFTISNHHPWIAPEHHAAPVFDSTLNLSHQRFLQTMHYTDHSLGLLMQLLREKKLSKKTVLVIVGDHSQPLGQHHGNFYYSRFLYEENVRVPLLIVAEGRISEPKTIEDIGSHVDLLPTLMDLLHLQGIQQGAGNSLVRKDPDRVAMLHNPYSEGFLGCRKGPWKWIENQLTQEGELYDVTVDPQEKQNQAENYPDIAASLRQEAKDYFQFIYELHRERKIIPSIGGDCPPSTVSFDFSTTMITDAELVQLASDHPKMEKLNLRDCLLVSDKGVASVLTACEHLEDFNLKGVTDLTDDAFAQLPRERLRTLHISEAALSDHGLEKIVKACPNLSVLSLQGKNLTDRGIQALSHLRHLGRLKILQMDNISEEALIGVLKNNSHLGHLVLQGCKNVSDRTLEALQAHPLELLWILDAPELTDEGIAYLWKLPIRFLTLEGCPLLTEKSIASLKQLNLEAAYLNCQGLVHL
jgi:phosphoglycerol transferase MdoB-like AlkP superfamily enzyme